MSSQEKHMRLGPLDHLPPRHYTRFVIYLSLQTDTSYQTAFSELQRGLHRTFIQLPWLNGKVLWESRSTPGWRPGQLEIRYTPIDPKGQPPWQLKYNELDCEADKFDELKELGFPADAFADEDLLSFPFAPDMKRGADVFIGQANFIPGACLLCAAVFHSVSDGMADVVIFKNWADNCQAPPPSSTGAVASGDNETEPAADQNSSLLPADSADRGLLDRLWQRERCNKPLAAQDENTAWGIIGLDKPASKHKKENRKKEKALQKEDGAVSRVDEEERLIKARARRLRDKFQHARNTLIFKALVKLRGEERVVRQILDKHAPQVELKSRIFYIPPASFTKLKMACNNTEEGGTGQKTIISGNDAVCALLWRSLMRARRQAADATASSDDETNSKIKEDKEDENSPSRLEMTVDGRPHFSLPPSYLGNVVLISGASLPCSTLISPSTSLSSVARTLRQAVDTITPSSALDAYSVARGLKGYDRFDTRSNPVAGSRMLITSLLTMPASSMGFGDRGIFGNQGRAEAIRPLMGAFNKYFRICFVMPPKSFGGVEVVFNLSDDELDFLLQDDEFGEYAMQVN